MEIVRRREFLIIFGCLGIVLLVVLSRPALREHLTETLSRALTDGHHTLTTARGRVTCFDVERGLLFIQNKDAAWRIETSDFDRISLGEEVEARGVLNKDDGLSLQSATVKPLHGGVLPPAVPLTAQQVSLVRFADQFVTVSGRITGSSISRFGSLEVLMQAGGRNVHVRVLEWTGLNPKMLAGADVRVSGVLDQTPDLDGKISRSMLVVYDRSGFNITSAPSAISVSSAGHMTEVRERGSGKLPVLTRVADVRQLSPKEAARRYPVLLKGVVTYGHLGDYSFFLQDRTGGIYVDGSDVGQPGVHAGEYISLTGLTGAGEFAPVIVSPHLTITGEARMPQAIKSSVSEILSGSLDSQWIEMSAIVRSVKLHGNEALLRADANGISFNLSILDVQQLPTWLLDAKIRIQGVCGSEFNRRRQLVGFHLQVPSLKYVQVESRPVAIAALPLRPISDFGTFQPQAQPGHRERVQGVITYLDPHEPIYMQDGTGSLEVNSDNRPGSLKVGDAIQAVGYASPGPFGPMMTAASLERLRAGVPASPHAIRPEDLLEQGSEGELVQLDAVLMDRVPVQSGERFVMRAGHIVFYAVLANQIGPDVSKGAILRMTGICTLRSRPQRPFVPVGFNLLLRSPQDITIIRQAPWWTARFVLWVLGALISLAFLITVWAISLRLHVRRQTRLIRTQLSEAESLKVKAECATRAKSEFLANMSHEIRTPLNGILGMTELAIDEAISPVARDYLQTARDCGYSLLKIVSDVLDLSKIEGGHISIESVPFNLEETVMAAFASLRAAAKAKNIELRVVYPSTAPRWFCGDPTKILQVALNLTANAVKFTEMGSVVLAVSCQSSCGDITRMRVEVRDTGIGIPLEEQLKIFQSFTQADTSTTRKYGGTGLGLTISKQLTELMGGVIGLESRPGQGSTFWFELPLPLFHDSDGADSLPALVAGQRSGTINVRE